MARFGDWGAAHQACVAEAVRHIGAHNALSEALDDGGLADAGLADEHRVVLGPVGGQEG